MRNSQWLLQLAVLTLLPGVCSNAQTRKENGSPPTSSQSFLSLDYANDGQSVDATVRERIELRLGAVGGPSYGDPQISLRLSGLTPLRSKSIPAAYSIPAARHTSICLRQSPKERRRSRFLLTALSILKLEK
jgi:hypothetical protein